MLKSNRKTEVSEESVEASKGVALKQKLPWALLKIASVFLNEFAY